MTHEVEGSHALISAQLARRYGESEGVVHAIEAHHYEVQPQTVEAVLLIAADADLRLATGRPRREPRELHQAARGARGDRSREDGRREGVRAPGGPRDPRDRQAGRDRRRRCSPALARDRARDRRPARVPGTGQGDGHPREPRHRGREIGPLAAEAWVDAWSSAWPNGDVGPVAALYADHALFYSHPFHIGYIGCAASSQQRDTSVSSTASAAPGRTSGTRRSGSSPRPVRLMSSTSLVNRARCGASCSRGPGWDQASRPGRRCAAASWPAVARRCRRPPSWSAACAASGPARSGTRRACRRCPRRRSSSGRRGTPATRSPHATSSTRSTAAHLRRGRAEPRTDE